MYNHFSNKAFGAKVRALRDQRGFSQEKLAELAGLHRTYISDVERGARNISLKSINKIAVALQVSAAFLLQDVQQALPGKLMDILLVEADHKEAELTLTAFRRANILNRVQVVNQVEAAVNFLLGQKVQTSRRPAERSPLVLLALTKVVDGLEVLRRLKADARTRSVPVVVVATAHRGKDAAACKRLGAAGYIVKPVNMENLGEATRHLNLQWGLMTADDGVSA